MTGITRARLILHPDSRAISQPGVILLENRDYYFAAFQFPNPTITLATRSWSEEPRAPASFARRSLERRSGKITLEKDYSAYDFEENEWKKRADKCAMINLTKDCSQLDGAYYEDGTGCGYCLDSDKIIFGSQKNPADPNNPGKFSSDVCGGGGKKNTWIPPGKDAAFMCQKAKDRAY